MTTPWQDYTLDATSKDGQKLRDLDETRRLLYSALYADRTKKNELVGTIVNALAHHGAGIDPDEAGPHVLAVIEGTADAAESEVWVREQIAKITELLG
jgi:hypothetical protein